MLPADHTINKPQGGIGGPKPSDCRSKISDMCGDFRRNFEEIPTLPEQTAVKTEGFSSSGEGKWLCHFVDPDMPSISTFLKGFRQRIMLEIFLHQPALVDELEQRITGAVILGTVHGYV